MTDRELIKHLASEYFGEFSADLSHAPDFYVYLLKHGYTRFALSALGIGKDIDAGDAQQWRGDQLN